MDYEARNNNNSSRQSDTTKSSIFPPKCKCEFCDISFKSDLDVSRHLISATHIRNRDNFKALHNRHDEVIEKQIPKNLAEVLKSLKLRDVRDLKELAEKGYFEVVDESIADIAGELASVLMYSVAEFEVKDLPPYVQEFMLESLKEPQKDEADEMESNDRSQEPQKESTSARKTKTNSARKNKPAPQQPSQSIPSTSSTNPNPVITNPHTSNLRPNLVPRPDSSYIPQLAKIKIEPKV